MQGREAGSHLHKGLVMEVESFAARFSLELLENARNLLWYLFRLFWQF